MGPRASAQLHTRRGRHQPLVSIPRVNCATQATPPPSRGAITPGFCIVARPGKIRGRRECRALAAPEASRAKNKKHGELVTTVTPVSPGIPRANGFNGFLRARPGDRALLPPSQVTMRKHRHQLDISVGISGPHDFAVRMSVARLATPPRPPHPAPTFRDDREAPLSMGTGWAEICA